MSNFRFVQIWDNFSPGFLGSRLKWFRREGFKVGHLMAVVSLQKRILQV